LTKTAGMYKLVIAMYRLRAIQ